MSFIKQLETIRRIDALIQRKSTGTPEQLAQKMSVSRASIYRYINDLKNLGAPVAYCRSRQSYYYTEAFELTF
ncbi:MAG: HTH domain-containing protein [Bacteroidota bacterium]